MCDDPVNSTHLLLDLSHSTLISSLLYSSKLLPLRYCFSSPSGMSKRVMYRRSRSNSSVKTSCNFRFDSGSTSDDCMHTEVDCCMATTMRSRRVLSCSSLAVSRAVVAVLAYVADAGWVSMALTLFWMIICMAHFMSIRGMRLHSGEKTTASALLTVQLAMAAMYCVR